MRSTLMSIRMAAAMLLALPLDMAGATLGPGAMLVPPDLAPASIFGSSVAASGNILAVGAPLNGNGAVYIFQRSGDDWIQQAKLVVSDGTSGFGSTLALDGNTLVADGHVFVNNNGTWTE